MGQKLGRSRFTLAGREKQISTGLADLAVALALRLIVKSLTLRILWCHPLLFIEDWSLDLQEGYC